MNAAACIVKRPNEFKLLLTELYLGFVPTVELFFPQGLEEQFHGSVVAGTENDWTKPHPSISMQNLLGRIGRFYRHAP